MRTCTGAEIEVILIRHGKTNGNREHRYVGKTDECLCEEGRVELQAKDLGEVDALFCGPMIRCQETAKILFPQTEIHIIDEWTEMDFGRFEMKTHEELADDTEYQTWIDSGGRLPFPEGESREAFIDRSMRGYEKMRKVLSTMKTGTRVAAVVHGGTIMAIASSIYGGDYFDYQVKNGEYIKL